MAKAYNFTKSNTHTWVFFRFLNCANGTKSHKASNLENTIHIFVNLITVALASEETDLAISDKSAVCNKTSDLLLDNLKGSLAIKTEKQNTYAYKNFHSH